MMRTWILVVALGACSGGGKRADTMTSGDRVPTDQGGTTSAPDDAAPVFTGVGIALDVTPREATVTIDDVMMGRANQLDPVVALAPGLHTLVVEYAGHKAYRAEFSVTDKVEKFRVVLEMK